MARYRLSIVLAFGAWMAYVACLISVIMSTVCWKTSGKKGSNDLPISCRVWSLLWTKSAQCMAHKYTFLPKKTHTEEEEPLPIGAWKCLIPTTLIYGMVEMVRDAITGPLERPETCSVFTLLWQVWNLGISTWKTTFHDGWGQSAQAYLWNVQHFAALLFCLAICCLDIRFPA